MLRESYLLDTLECGDFSFATACLLANRKYGKNTQRDDIKSHQYIISFDPRDAADNGLTMEKAQALGLKFCEENFPGHPAIVCTHPDGHNHSGNIHVHIVIGSIRTREVERKPYMQKPRDWREGMKHSSTAQTMRHLRVEVMELCEGAELYQIDLLNGSKERVSEAEYWARRRGQLKLDRENAALTAAGQPPKQKKFETVKDTLRKQISSVLYRAVSLEDFSDRLMQQYGIAVKESRGCLSYLPAGRNKFIRAKHLGDKFDKAAVLATLQANAERKPKSQFKQDTIGKLIDIQSKMTEGKGIGYKRWLTKHNLKVMAQTVKLLQEKGLTDEDALNQRITELETKYHDSLAVVKDLEGRMKTNKELCYHVAAYASTKSVTQQLKTAKRPTAFEEQHRAELTAYRAAAAYFKANNITKLPSPKKLEAEYLKTKAAHRVIPIPDKLRAILLDTPHLSRYIVPASNGGDMTRSAFTRMWNSHVVSLVPFPLHPHMLRHTYATTLYRARVDLRTAQKLMGHSSIQVTADIYTHLEQEDSLHVADKLNEYLSGKSENSVKSSQKVVKLAI